MTHSWLQVEENAGPAKLGARWGQSNSTSREGCTVLPSQIEVIDDINPSKDFSGGHSDGHGFITADLAAQLQDKGETGLPGSEFHIRALPYKGTLAIVPYVGRTMVSFRKSMEKFGRSDPNAPLKISVIKVARYKPGFLNQQYIIGLGDLGVPTENFQAIMLAQLDRCPTPTNYLNPSQLLTQLDNAPGCKSTPNHRERQCSFCGV